jgi:hypothetical protein
LSDSKAWTVNQWTFHSFGALVLLICRANSPCPRQQECEHVCVCVCVCVCVVCTHTVPTEQVSPERPCSLRARIQWSSVQVERLQCKEKEAFPLAKTVTFRDVSSQQLF